MKTRLPSPELLFPELFNSPENPWITASAKRIDLTGSTSGLTTLELCAGAGGQALGLEQAGIDHAGLVEINKHACATLRLNRPAWNVIESDLNTFDGSSFKGVDVISGGLPCPPFSVVGRWWDLPTGSQDICSKAPQRSP